MKDEFSSIIIYLFLRFFVKDSIFEKKENLSFIKVLLFLKLYVCMIFIITFFLFFFNHFITRISINIHLNSLLYRLFMNFILSTHENVLIAFN